MKSYEKLPSSHRAPDLENNFSPLKPAPQQGTADKVSNVLGICIEGWPWVGLGFFITLLTVVFLGKPWVFIAGILNVWVAWFFRDPTRTPPQDLSAIVSPADGTIIDISTPSASAWMGRDELEGYIRISVFMSVFNVHINRIPCEAVIQKLSYNTGKFLSAFKEKASLENEQMALWLNRKNGKPILIVQIAGLIARRIVCKVRQGEPVVRGMKFGLIRFGSRMDVYLPKNEVEIKAKKGDRVKAGETVLANTK